MADVQNQQTPEQQIDTIYNTLREREVAFYNKIVELNDMLKTSRGVDDLMNRIHADRTTLADYYFKMKSWQSRQETDYIVKKADAYNRVKLGEFNGLAYKSDTQINVQVEAGLSFDKKRIDILKTHVDYIKDMMKTMDNMLYSINNKLKLYEIMGQGLVPK